jgi:anti-sigma regulatory factor (Ser/Thr protein kinase)
MRVYFPNSGHLANFGGFARRQDMSDPSFLDFGMHPSYVSVHPLALSMAAAAAQRIRDEGGEVRADLAGSDRSIRYLSRMKLTDVMGVDPGLPLTEHAPEGRFIPVTQVLNQRDLNDFVVDMVPLLHATPDEAGPIKYVVTELVRNVLEHAGSRVGAMVAAQYYARTERLSIGVADLGIGLRRSLALHRVGSDIEAIHLALRPGVTGTTLRLGGNEQNAGAGLFFIKSIALASGNHFVIYSGTAMFKLLRGRGTEQPVLLPDPVADRATREIDLPLWPGTAVGVDISIAAANTFADLLAEIRQAYRLDVRDRTKAKYRRPKFA